MRFTGYADSWINEKVRDELEVVCEEILRNLNGVKSIVLTGGFARGEGSVEVSDNEVMPLNDFDIYIISEGPLPERQIVKASIDATRRLRRKAYSFYESSKTLLDTFCVDLRFMELGKLRHLPPLIRYYEMKHSGLVLYGENILDQIPNYSVYDIPLSEEARYLLNRMSHLIEYFSPHYLLRPLNSVEKKSVIFACSKAFLECCAALLLMSRRYEPTYVGRMQTFSKTYQKDFSDLYQELPSLAEKVRLFTEFKMKPSFRKFQDPVKWWFTAREYIGTVARYYFERFLQRNIADWVDFSQQIYKNMWKPYLFPYVSFYVKNHLKMDLENRRFPLFSVAVQLYLNAIYTLRLVRFKRMLYLNPLFRCRSPDIRIYSAVPLMLFSINKNGRIARSMLEAAVKRIKEVYPIDFRHEEDEYELWDACRQAFGNAYRLFFFQKLI